MDAWLASLYEAATASTPSGSGTALVAVGGYGRAELAPSSDIDVVLLHRRRGDIASLADRLWYPVWDRGIKLGHAVRTVAEALSLGRTSFDTATALLSTRHLAGDESLSEELHRSARAQWRARAPGVLSELAATVAQRHQRAGEVAFLLEPDLKEGRGGLRDVHALGWAGVADDGLLHALDGLAEPYRLLLAARVELHRATSTRGEVLRLQDQDTVAELLGLPDADALMAQVAAAGRTIAWASDEVWRGVGMRKRGLRRDRPVALGDGLTLVEGEVDLEVAGGWDPVQTLRAATAAAGRGTRIRRSALEEIAASAVPLHDPWPPGLSDALVAFLSAGDGVIAVCEALDQLGVWVCLLPEWEPVRSRPQRNAYHRFTVDRHLLEAATGAARLASSVRRADLLVIGALLHDLGKGYPGDHTEVGVELMRVLGERMGFGPDDVDTLVALVEHHLLLPDVATRRDLDDPATIDRVAVQVRTLERLELLAALTEADSIATGPAAWSAWKAGLVADLAHRVAHVLAGGTAADVVGADFPSATHLAAAEAGERLVDAEDNTLTVLADDRPGLFSRVAGVLCIHGLGVRSAQAWSSDEGTAVASFTVESHFGGAPNWNRVRVDLDAAFNGRLALSARVADKARTYERPPTTAEPVRTVVSFDTDASAEATVIDVQAPDSLGVLFRLTRALAELDLDIRSARVSTVGDQAVDAFYVRDRAGGKVRDPAYLAEIERALRAAVDG